MRPNLRAIAGIALVLSLAAPATVFAVSAFDTGDSFLEATDEEYRHGYIAGAVDMLAVLEDAGYLGSGNFGQRTRQMIECLKSKKIDDIQDMYQQRLKNKPDKKSNAAASSIYFAVKEGCGL